ncbi:hypothetical protein ACFFRR_000115 [Megaselia abdita]
MVCKILSVLALACFIGLSYGQSSSVTPTIPTTTQIPQYACSNLNANTTMNYTMLSGVWYELARKPVEGGAVDLNCVTLTMTVVNTTTAWVNASVSQSTANYSQHTWINQTMDINQVNLGQFQLESNGTVSPVVYKVLASDYSNYLLICGYSNVNQPAGAFVFSRNVNTNYTSYDSNYASYSDFNTLNTVYQGSKCNSANSSLPMAGLLFAIVYSILKYFN